ncbi:Oidioi.mRNA.OKI2018_I69.chr2.g5815.t1.cds [Oikopleura dioica]|uniref:Oidioi.mRNA.OKI2018_I69.chr2.g5815.t1.cds n=1 Tax=Oikopleura dioica TaxID=34765 RepID=A0ABN7T148_OIKDI|nr:Oidioi.mRNA.OKI2018_I69.chr2.g5815.t1.cds [Oikopleura dioica]
MRAVQKLARVSVRTVKLPQYTKKTGGVDFTVARQWQNSPFCSTMESVNYVGGAIMTIMMIAVWEDLKAIGVGVCGI